MAFKKGDEVKCIRANSGFFGELGKTYTVKELESCEDIFLNEMLLGEIAVDPARFELVGAAPVEFQIGDTVEAFGVAGTVIRSDLRGDYPVGASFPIPGQPDRILTFKCDGIYWEWHKAPTLKLVSRPKRMITKKLEAWANVYPHFGPIIHMNEESADAQQVPGRIACVKLTGTYEVEE